MITDLVRTRVLKETKQTVDDYLSGHLEGNMGYKFRTRAFLEVIFLYINSVDVGNPDILGKTNRNTFIYEAQEAIAKIKEQIRLDIKDLGFQVNGGSSLARFIPRAANRKMLDDNNFAVDLDDIPDNAVDFGSGFLKVWEADNRMNMRSIDPLYMIFNQYNFKDGLKIERLRKSYRWIIENKKYDADEIAKVIRRVPEDEWDKEIVFYQVVRDLKNGGQEISIVNLDDEEIYYHFESKEKIISYYKYDYEKRKGFPDALGRGANEKIFNRLVQSKVNRERLDRVLEVASVLAFQKEMDNERDNWVGKEMIKIKPSSIIGHKGNEIKPLDLGGVKQANMITAQLSEIVMSVPSSLSVGEALMGNTMPSGTSGALGNLLTENNSSVLKEHKKDYAKFISVVYKERLTPYLLKVFDSEANLRDYLDPNDIRLVETAVINYLVAQKQIDAAINDVPFDLTLSTEEVKREIEDKPLISGDLLDSLRKEVKGIRTFITGENISKAQTVAFLREMRANYTANPGLFRDPFYIELLKKEAEFEQGISGIEIDNLLKELPEDATIATEPSA